MKPRSPWLLLLLLLTATFSLTSPSMAQDATPVSDDEVNEVAQDLFCPVCENTPLDVCPTQACAQWRELIREKLSLGWSEAQIKDYFVEQYGGQVLAVPPRTGVNWIVYVLPPLVFVGGVVLLVNVMKRSKKTATATNNMQPSLSPSPKKVMDQIEEDLRKEE